MQHHYYHIVAASGDAVAGQGVIGNKNKLPWPKFSEDLQFFKTTTAGTTVIMGRKTFESIGQKPLPNRENIVISRSPLSVPENVKVFSSIEEAMRNAGNEKVFIIGGAEIYRQTIDKVEGIFLTSVEGNYSGDTCYPPIPSYFKPNEEKSRELEEKHKIKVRYFENTGTVKSF